MTAIIITNRDIDRCPKHSLSASHYYLDKRGVVHCRCEQRAKVIR